MDERRNFQRIPFSCKAGITCNSSTYSGELIDISLQGALVLCKGGLPFAEGSRCELAIYLLDSEITLTFAADIIHCYKKRFGFKFISYDAETATHLRRLLELNIGSSEAMAREVAFLLQNR